MREAPRPQGGSAVEQIEKLWEFQQADMAADRFEREIQKNPNRLKLLKHREFMLQQQEVMKRIESEVDAMAERMDGLTAEISRLEEELLDLQDTLKEKEPETIEIARKSLSYAQKLVTALEKAEKDLTKLRRDADARDRQQHEVRVRAAKVRAEFDALKKVYDGEYREQAAKLQKLRAEAAKAAEGIDPAMLAKYKEIKQHCAQPIAKLVDGNRCGGCNMNLPQVLMGQIKQGAKSVECENCGRIVIVE